MPPAAVDRLPSPTTSPKRRGVLGLVAVVGAGIVGAPLLHGAWTDRTMAAWHVSLDEARAELDAGRAWLVDIREPS